MEKLTESESLIQLKERALALALALAGANSFPREEDLAWARRLSLPKAEELLVHILGWDIVVHSRIKACAAELAGTAILADSETGSWDALPLLAYAAHYYFERGAWNKASLLAEQAIGAVSDSPPQPRTADDYLEIYNNMNRLINPENSPLCHATMKYFWYILPKAWHVCDYTSLLHEFEDQRHRGQTPTPIYILQNEYQAVMDFLRDPDSNFTAFSHFGKYNLIKPDNPSEDLIESAIPNIGEWAFDLLKMSIQLRLRYRIEAVDDVLGKIKAEAEQLSQDLIAAAERRGIESSIEFTEYYKKLLICEINIQEVNLLFKHGLYSRALETYERYVIPIKETDGFSLACQEEAAVFAAAGNRDKAEDLLLKGDRDHIERRLFAGPGSSPETNDLLSIIEFNYEPDHLTWALGRVQFENGKFIDGIEKMRDIIEHWPVSNEFTSRQLNTISLLFAEANLARITTMPKAEQTVHLERQEKELRHLLKRINEDDPFKTWANVVLAENLEVQNNEIELMSILGQPSLYGPSAKTSSHFLSVRAYASKARCLWRSEKRPEALSCLRVGIELLEEQYHNLNRQPLNRSYWMRPWDRRWQPLYEMLLEMQLELRKPLEAFATLQGLIQVTLADTFAGPAGIDFQRFLTPGELADWQSLLDEEEQSQKKGRHAVATFQTAIGKEKDRQKQIINAVNRSLETCYDQEKQLMETARERAGIPLDPGMVRRIGPQEIAKVIEKYDRAAVAQVWRLRKKAMTADNLSSLACGYRQFAGYNRQVEADGATDEDQELIVFVVTGKGLVKHFKLSSNSSKKVLTSCSKARDKTVEAFKAGSPHSDQTKEIFREAEKAEREALSIVGKELISPILKAAERPKTLFLSFPPGPLWGLAWSALPSGLFHSGFLADKVNLSFLAYAGHLNSIHQRQRQSRPNHREGCLAIGSSGGDTGSWPVELLPEAIATLPNCQREWSAIAGNKASPEALLKVSGNFDSVVFGLHNKMEDRCRSLGTFALNNGSSLSFADILSMVQFKTRYLFGGTCEGSPLESQSAFNPWVSIDFGLLENKQAYAMVGTTQKVDALDTFILALRVTELMEQEPELGLGDALRRGQKWLRSQTAPELAKYLTGINQRLLEDGDSLCSHQLEKWIGMYKDMPREHFSLARPWRGRPYPRPYSGLVHWAYYILFGAGSPPSR
jgi:hypothetical protein